MEDTALQEEGIYNEPVIAGIPHVNGDQELALALIFYLLELLCLNMDFMRYDMLRLYALRWGGIRKSCYFEPLQKQRFLRTGIISVSILVVSVIAVFFIL